MQPTAAALFVNPRGLSIEAMGPAARPRAVEQYVASQAVEQGAERLPLTARIVSRNSQGLMRYKLISDGNQDLTAGFARQAHERAKAALPELAELLKQVAFNAGTGVIEAKAAVAAKVFQAFNVQDPDTPKVLRLMAQDKTRGAGAER